MTCKTRNKGQLEKYRISCRCRDKETADRQKLSRRRNHSQTMLGLQGYDFKVVYRPGKTNIADVLFCLNSVKQLDCGEEYDFIRAVVESCVPVGLSPKEIEEASYSDEEL